MGQEQLTFVGLMAAAEAVVAVEILSTDYTLTAKDGPMVATVRVLKEIDESGDQPGRVVFDRRAT